MQIKILILNGEFKFGGYWLSKAHARFIMK